MMGTRLMIVDDSLFVYEEMKHMLEHTDVEIVGYARSGKESIELYETLMPDIVTMDIIMPGVDGLETARQILARWPEAKIIMVSSLAYDETMEDAKNIGAVDFLFKPIDRVQIQETLVRVCQQI